MKKLTTLICGAVLCVSATFAQAPKPTIKDIPSKELMGGFWACWDIAESTLGKGTQMPPAEEAICDVIMIEVVQRHFGGDFHNFLVWLAVNKDKRPTELGSNL